MKVYLNIVALSRRPGIVVHVRRYRNVVSKLIRVVLGGSWGNHDALGLGAEGYGDSIFPKSVVTPWEKLQEEMDAGLVEVRFYWPRDATPEQGARAATWWLAHVKGTWYDVLAYPHLFWESVLRFSIPWCAGTEWANWCTEGCSESWRNKNGGEQDAWRKRDPTPRTTEKRVESGDLLDVTLDFTSALPFVTDADERWCQEA